MEIEGESNCPLSDYPADPGTSALIGLMSKLNFHVIGIQCIEVLKE